MRIYFFLLYLLLNQTANVKGILSTRKAIAVLVGENKKAVEYETPFQMLYSPSLPHCLNKCLVNGCLSFNLHLETNQCSLYKRSVCGDNGYQLQNGDQKQNHYTIHEDTKDSPVSDWMNQCWPKTTTTKPSTTTEMAPITTSTILPTTSSVTTTTTPISTTAVTTTTTSQSTTTLQSSTASNDEATTTAGKCSNGILIDRLCFLIAAKGRYKNYENQCVKLNAQKGEFLSDVQCTHFRKTLQNTFPETPKFFIPIEYKPSSGQDKWKFGTNQLATDLWKNCWNGEPKHTELKDCVAMIPPEFQLEEINCNNELNGLCVYVVE